MRAPAILATGLLLAGCDTAKPAFDLASLKASDDPVTLTGWFDPAEDFRQFRLYAKSADIGSTGKGVCVSGIATSLAGIPTAEFKGKRMAISGNLYAANGPDVGDTKDACGTGLILIANDISVPEK